MLENDGPVSDRCIELPSSDGVVLLNVCEVDVGVPEPPAQEGPGHKVQPVVISSKLVVCCAPALAVSAAQQQSNWMNRRTPEFESLEYSRPVFLILLLPFVKLIEGLKTYT